MKNRKLHKDLLRSVNSYASWYDDLKGLKISRNRRAKRKTLKIRIKDIGYGKW